MVVINWFLICYDLSSLVLEPWQRKIRDLQESFFYLQVFHIYKNFNKLVDGLSKLDL